MAVAVARERAARRPAMRIDVVVYSYERGLGDMGGIRKLLGLAQGFRDLGHSVTLIAPRFLPVSASGVDVVGYGSLPGPVLRPLSAYLGMAWTIWRRRGRVRPDLIYARTSRTVLPGLVSRVLGARFFFEINGDAFGEQGWRGGLLRALTILGADWLNCRLAHRIVALTPGLAAMIERRYGAPPQRVRVVPSGTDVTTIRPLERDECRRSLGLPAERPIIVFTGVLYEHQGVRTLLACALDIVRRAPGALVLVVGDGPARSGLEADAKGRGLDGIVRFVGRVPYDHLALYLGAADCCVAPFSATRGEASPLKLFDYMAAARPVVAAAIPSITDLISKSQAIIAVPPDDATRLADAVVGLLRDPARGRRLGEAGRRFVEMHHDWRALAGEILDE